MASDTDRTWDLSALAIGGVRDLVDACRARGPQSVTHGGETVAVMLSVKDWRAIRELLKNHLVEGIRPRSGHVDSLSNVVELFPGDPDGPAQS